jgi:hypothetical protein
MGSEQMMMWSVRTFPGIILLGVCLAAPSAGLAAEEGKLPDTSIAIGDTVFTEIVLNDQGVQAYDVTGGKWMFDFSDARWHPAPVLPADDGLVENEDIIIPIPRRMMEERHVSDLERTVLIGYDEFVNGNVVAHGKVTVKGWVKGNVQSYSGKVLVTESGQVDGDVRAPEIEVKEGGVVLGQQIITEPIEFPFDVFKDRFSAEGMWIVLGFSLFFLLAGFMTTSLMPTQLVNVDDCLSRHPARSFLLGFIFVPLLPILLTVSILGIPLLLLLPLVYLFAITIGMITSGRSVDRRILQRYWRKRGSLFFAAVMGILLYMALWTVVAILMGSSDSTSRGFGIFFLVVAILASSIALCVGLGSLLLTRFGFRSYYSYREREAGRDEAAPAPAPPPIPHAPPISTGRPTPDEPSGPTPPPRRPPPDQE